MDNRKKPLVTIYTQGYNSEPYIAKCIESVLAQTYDNFEYYVCNHGSKDRTLSIIQKYAKEDSRIHVMDMPNSARGFYPGYIIENGKGKYFSMLDSDDYLTPDCIEKLVDFAEDNNLDMAFGGIYSFKDSNPSEISVERQLSENIVFDIKDNGNYFSEVYDFMRTTWGKIVRLDVMKKADYSTYKKNAQTFICDDTAFTLANYEQCRRIGGIKDGILYYRYTDTSVTAKYNKALPENNFNIFLQSDQLLEHIGDNSDESYKQIIATYLGSIVYTGYRILEADLSTSEKINEVNKIFKIGLLKVISDQGLMAGEVTLFMSNLLHDLMEDLTDPTKDDMDNIKYMLNEIAQWV